VSIWTSVFRSFNSGDQQIILFRETDSRFPAAASAIALGVSVCLISNVVTKRIISAHDDFDPEMQSLTLSEEMSSIQWITNKQGGSDCPQKVRSKG
jgi:hypothetical protein